MRIRTLFFSRPLRYRGKLDRVYAHLLQPGLDFIQVAIKSCLYQLGAIPLYLQAYHEKLGNACWERGICLRPNLPP